MTKKLDEISESIGLLTGKVDGMCQDFKEVKDDVKTNTKFRQQAGGFIAAIVMIAGFVGSAVTLAINFFRGGTIK